MNNNRSSSSSKGRDGDFGGGYERHENAARGGGGMQRGRRGERGRDMDNTSPIQTGYESHPPGNGGDGGSRSWQSPPPLKGVLKKKGSVKDGQAGAGGIYNLKGGRKGSSVRIVEHDDDTQ